jgi:hypothetical protein
VLHLDTHLSSIVAVYLITTMSYNGNTGGANHTQAIQIDTDSSPSEQGEVYDDFDTDSDGGMQIDQPEPILQIAGSEIEFDAQVMGLARDGEFTIPSFTRSRSFK